MLLDKLFGLGVAVAEQAAATGEATQEVSPVVSLLFTFVSSVCMRFPFYVCEILYLPVNDSFHILP